MRADRLLALLMLLQSRRKTTAARLAAELEVSERTIYRDAQALAIDRQGVIEATEDKQAREKQQAEAASQSPSDAQG